MRRLIIFLAVSIGGLPALSYERFRTPSGVPLFRADHQNVRFQRNSAFTSGARNADGQVMLTADSDPEAALKKAMTSWSRVANSAIRFSPLVTTDTGHNTSDGQHVFVLQDSPELRSAVGSALAITLTAFSLDGTILDSDIVFNPAISSASGQIPFSTTQAPNTYDLRGVAAHEIGHSLGANHYVFLGGTMLHFTLPNSTVYNFLSSDEEAFASSTYPMPFAPLLLGAISGTVMFKTGGPVRVAAVNAVDPATGISAGALSSRTDGVFTIAGLPPGRYLVYAEPLNLRVLPGNVSTPDSAADTSFQPLFFGGNANPALVEVTAARTSPADITVTAGASTISIPTMGHPVAGTGSYLLGGGAELVAAGQSLEILIFGPGLDATITAANVRLLGPGLSIRPGSLRLDPRITVNGLPALRMMVDAASGANRVMATVIVVKGSEVAVVSGGLVVTVPEPQGDPPARLEAVNAASLTISAVAPDSFVTLFGDGLAERLVIADKLPLPNDLGGTRILIRDSAGAERPAGLLFVAPKQANLLIPAGTALGLGVLRVTSPLGTQNLNVLIEAISPGLFTANAGGRGAPAAAYTRVNADGSRSDGLVYQLTEGRPPLPIDLGGTGDQVFLSFFGTGIRGFSRGVSARIGGIEVPVLGAGAQGQYDGLDQVNVGPVPRSLAGGETTAMLTADGKPLNTVTLAFK